MCGIAGIINQTSNTFQIDKILEKIRHRGPDGLSYWKNDRVSFGHARLRIIDLTDNGNQPMLDESTGNCIVFNGEIYNYLELKKLIGTRYVFKTNSDTEVILAAYRIFGLDFFAHLRGMFSFALYDNDCKKVLLARDRFGIKPLYYRKINDTFLFASEIKALLHLTSAPEQVNESKAYDFLADCQLDCTENTLFKNILQLLPAHYAWVDGDGQMSDSKEYWSFPKPGIAHFTNSSEEDFLSVFTETIGLHLRSDVPVGAFLSGGIDSSSIACFALKSLNKPLSTFSGILPYYHPENVLIDEVLQSDERFIAHKFLMTGEDYFKDIMSVIYHHDEPIMDGSVYSHFKLCEIVRQNNIKVVLSGSGGDELFGGYASHVHAQHAKLLCEFRISDWINDMKQVNRNTNMSFKSLLFKSGYENLPMSFRRYLKQFQLRKRIQHIEGVYHPLHYHYKDSDLYLANVKNYYKSWSAPPFLHYEDRNSMAFGIEARVPFFDHKLIEYVLQFRSEDIVKGQSKSLLRNSFKGLVPEKILQQKGKYGFPSPIDHALKNDQYGRELFFDLYRQTPLLKRKETEKLGKDFYENSGNISIFWRTFSYILWYNIFFKGGEINAI